MVFGIGLAMHVDVLLGVFQMNIGLCNTLLSTIYLLENPVQRYLFSDQVIFASCVARGGLHAIHDNKLRSSYEPRTVILL